MRILSKQFPIWNRLLMNSYKQSACYSAVSKYNVLFFGNDEFSLPHIVRLMKESKNQNGGIVKSLEVVTLLNDSGHFNPVQNFACHNEIPIYLWDEFRSALKPHGFDIAVVASFGIKFTDNLIESFPLGMINVHPSFLPDLQGAAPIARALEKDYNSTGVSIFKITPGKMDNGVVLAKSAPVEIGPEQNAEKLCDNLAIVGAQLCLDVLHDLPNKLKYAQLQDKTLVTKAPKISLKDTCVQWDEMTAADIYNKFRGFGYLRKYRLCAFYDNRLVKFRQISIISDVKMYGIKDNSSLPGQVFYKRIGKLMIVACKEGFIGIHDLVVSRYQLKLPPLNITKLHKDLMHPKLDRGEKVVFKNSYYCSKKIVEYKT